MLLNQTSYVENSNAVEVDSNNQNQFNSDPAKILNRLRSLRKNIDPTAARKFYLEHKPYTTLEEDRELQLLNDPATSAFAARMTSLEFNEHRTSLEDYELKLLSDPEARSIAYRLLALELNQNRTKEQTIEMRCLRNPIIRPHTDKIMSYVNRSDLSAEEMHDALILLNPHTLNHADEILALEKMKDLTLDQKISLSKDYLLKICKVAIDTKHDYKHEYFGGAAFNPDNNCVQIDNRFFVQDMEAATFRAIENAFNKSANKLTESYFRQAMARSSNTSSQANYNSRMFADQNMLANPRIKSIIQERQVALALVLEKFYFDNDINFSQQSLDFLTEHLQNLVVNKQLALNTSNFKDLENLILQNLKIIEKNLSEPNTGGENIKEPVEGMNRRPSGP